eukprot:COSAG03_NODE_11692_length_580_cov_1.178794_1_plen_140_part_01
MLVVRDRRGFRWRGLDQRQASTVARAPVPPPCAPWDVRSPSSMPKGFKNMKAKAKQKATNYAAKKLYGADVIEAVAQDWWASAAAAVLHCRCVCCCQRTILPDVCCAWRAVSRLASWTRLKSGWTRTKRSSAPGLGQMIL